MNICLHGTGRAPATLRVQELLRIENAERLSGNGASNPVGLD